MYKKFTRKHIGKKFKTKKSLGAYNIEVIDGGEKPYYCTIRFDDKFKTEIITSFDSVKKGSVKNPNHKSVCGVGYFGIGNHKARIDGKVSKCYSIWRGIIRRCYDKNSKSYEYYGKKGITVEDSWHNFQNFADWFYKHYKKKRMKNWQLDKDIISEKKNLQYSAKNCCFVPIILNNFFTNEQVTNKTGFVGVHFDKSKRKFIAQISFRNKKIHLGNFETLEEAVTKYKSIRKCIARKLRKDMKKINLNKIIINKII